MDNIIWPLKRIKLTKFNVQFPKFVFIGIINTIIGLGIIYLLIYGGFNNYISNIIGYTVGLLISFILNKYYVFKSSPGKHRVYNQFIKFIFIFFIAYATNVFVLFISLDYMTSYLAQLIAMLVYTSISFVLNKAFTFKDY